MLQILDIGLAAPMPQTGSNQCLHFPAESEGAVSSQVQSCPPGLPAPTQESQEASQTMLNNCLASQEAGKYSN